MTNGLQSDITTSMWIDALGRRLRLWRNALPEVRERLEGTLNSELANADLVALKNHLLGLIMTGSPSSLFIAEDKDHRLPIPVMSSITPRTPSDFLLHRPEGPNRNSAASLDRGRRCLTPIYGEIQINSDQKFYRAQRRNYYVLDLVRKSL